MNCKTYQFGESLKIFKNIFGDSTRIKEHRCPRCKAKIWFNSNDEFEESMKKPFLTCPTCFAPYKISLDKGEKKLIVERLTHRVDIPIEVKNLRGETWTVYEPSITDNEFQTLKKAVGTLKYIKNYTILDGILSGLGGIGFYYGFVDPMTGMGWGTYAPPPSSDALDYFIYKKLNENLFRAASELCKLYNTHPYQVRKILKRLGMEKVLDYISIVCLKCGMVIPMERAGNCPFCRKPKPEGN